MNKQINWVIVCTVEENGEMYSPHMVGYEDKPDTDTIVDLIRELATDEEFGMTQMEYNKDYKISVAERNGPLKEWFDETGVPLEFEV